MIHFKNSTGGATSFVTDIKQIFHESDHNLSGILKILIFLSQPVLRLVVSTPDVFPFSGHFKLAML